MSPCYDPAHALTPENPARLRGPEPGALCRYTYKRRHEWTNILVRIVARSYVWSPEQHNPDGTHGSRRYDWSVIEYAPGRTMVVDDTALEPVALGAKLGPRWCP